MPITAYLIALLLGTWLTYRRIQRPANYPPGPRGIFSFFALNQQGEPLLHKAMSKLSETFGSVVGFRIWHRKLVCVNGYKATVEALNNPCFSGRPNSFDFNLRTNGKRFGILMTEGQLWREQRRFSLRHLKDLGFGKSSMEYIMLEEIQELMTELGDATNSSSDNNILLDDIFTSAVLNVLWGVVASTRFERGDPKSHLLISCMNGFMRTSNGGPNIRTVLPFAHHFAPELTGYNKLREFIRPLRSYIEEEVEEHKRTRVTNAPRDFIDVYLEAIDGEANQESSFHEEQLLGIIFDIMVAGSETTSHTLGFALLYMIHYPDVQTKVQEELDRVLNGRPPSLSDRGRLPYTEATLTEIQRIGIVAPLTVPHVAEQDTTCQGYFIPKDSLIFINLWSAHMDEEVWPNPAVFSPERHLNSGGRAKKAENILTFGLGKRSCIGETLARATLFIFFISILQQFRFELPNDPDMDLELKPSLEPILGLTLAPRACVARVLKRVAS